MLKRTKGRILLTLLVVTGFAGTVNNSTLTTQERKFVVSNLKETKTDLLKNIGKLSEAQLNFKPSPDQLSIKESFFHLVLTENGLWNMLEASMKTPATPEKRSEIKLSDEYLSTIIIDNSTKVPEHFKPGKAIWQSMDEAISSFKASRLKHLKYVKTTTEDLRNHLIQLPVGWIDDYQFIIFIAEHSNRLIYRINQIMTDPRFPKK